MLFSHYLPVPGLEVVHELLLFSKCMAKMASMPIGTDITSKDHPANLSLVARVADYRSELFNAVSKLAVIAIRTGTSLLPFVTEFSFEHALVVHFQFKRLFLLLSALNVHLLLHIHLKGLVSISILRT